MIAGCQNKNHPDEKSAVTNSLNTNNLGSMSVSQDQEKDVMTLKGDVVSTDQKSQAESIAKQSAPDYTIANEIGVRPLPMPALSLRTSTLPSRTISRLPSRPTRT